MALTRIFVQTVLGFYREGGGGQSGAVVAVQTSSDLKLARWYPAVVADSSPPRSPKNPAAVILACTVLFGGAKAALAAHYLGPKGERVGELDLVNPSTVALDLSSPRALNFRLDVTVVTKGPQSSSRSARDAIYEKLAASSIAVSDTGPTGAAARATTCAAFDGKSTSASSSASEVEIHGIPVVCSLALPAGRHGLMAKVVWAKDLDVRAAALEVRSEPARE